MSATSPRRATGWSNGSRTAACWCALPARISPATDDDLVPVKLRRGGRILGGSLSWDKPQQLAGFSRDSPFNGMAVPERRDRHAPGAGRARRAADRPHLGDARRRHAAGHRAAPRQGHADRAVPCHRRHALVGPAAVRRLRRHAQAHRRAVRRGRQQRSRRGQPPTMPRPPVGAADPRARRLRRFRHAAADRAAGARPISPPAPAPTIRPASTARRKAWSRSIRWRPPTGRRRSISPRSTRASTSIGTASRSTCAGRSSWPRWRC